MAAKSDASKWYEENEEAGNMYAKAEAFGASQVVLATKARVETYLTTKTQITGGIYIYIF